MFLLNTRSRPWFLKQGFALSLFFTCLISGITSTDAAKVDNETNSNIQPPTVTIQIPEFALRLLVHQDLINPSLFRSHIHHITNNHLTDYWMDILEESFNAESFQGLTLQSTLREDGDENDTRPQLQLDVTFSGYLTVLMESNHHFPDEPFVRSRFENSITGDKYWNLVQRFVEDPVLENIDSVDVIFMESMNPKGTKGNEGAIVNRQGPIAILVIFSSIFLLATLALLYLSHRRFHTKSKSCCSQHSRSSEGTENADEDVEDEDDASEAFHHHEGKPIKARSSATPKRPKKRKRRGTIIDTRSSPQVPNLDSIQEEDEDGMTVMPTEEDEDDDDAEEDFDESDDVNHVLSQTSPPVKIRDFISCSSSV